MKTVCGVTLLFLAGIWEVGSHGRVAAFGKTPQVARSREPVVVELFTSEGCSSCPPADTLLAELDARQPIGSAEVIGLEEHVTYWDQQGWEDPYDSRDWTDRQTDYANSLHNGSPYTPEMVVDGTAGFVGSRGGTAVKEIEKAAAIQKSKVAISVAYPTESKSLELKVSVEKLLNPSPKDKPEVILAITESGLHSAVGAGENSGKELHHSAVLREMKVIGVVGKNGQETFFAEHTVKLDSKWKRENLRAVAFVQEKKSRRILGAAEIRVMP